MTRIIFFVKTLPAIYLQYVIIWRYKSKRDRLNNILEQRKTIPISSAVINLTGNKTREQAELKLERNPEGIYGLYNFSENAIILDVWKLGVLVNEKVNGARSVEVDLGDPEVVWISKFASVVSHETIHKVLHELEGEETSKRFDCLYLAYFMDKIPPHSIHVSLWSDAFETCPIGDTWFS